MKQQRTKRVRRTGQRVRSTKKESRNYKAYVGPATTFGIAGKKQFELLQYAGLLPKHKLLDIGCGSLRAGKYIIPYSDEGNYYGLEPNKWLIKEGIQKETGKAIIEEKKPHFNYNAEFNLSEFNTPFDFILAQSIFSHASARQITTCLSEVKKVLTKEGLFLATFDLGTENYIQDAWVYPDCVGYKPEFVLSLITKQGLVGYRTNWDHWGLKRKQTWYIICHPNHQNKAYELSRR
jgi:SAM-dependent methyltransferase